MIAGSGKQARLIAWHNFHVQAARAGAEKREACRLVAENVEARVASDVGEQEDGDATPAGRRAGEESIRHGNYLELLLAVCFLILIVIKLAIFN